MFSLKEDSQIYSLGAQASRVFPHSRIRTAAYAVVDAISDPY